MVLKKVKSPLGPKSKTDKKIDNNIRLALTSACEQMLKDIDGFIWLTHQANFTNFPASLLITCVFETEAQRQQALELGGHARIEKVIQAKLLKAGIKFKSIGRQVIYDSQEACDCSNNGSWAERLAAQEGRAVPKLSR